LAGLASGVIGPERNSAESEGESPNHLIVRLSSPEKKIQDTANENEKENMKFRGT
jgi:hypothetical protein